MGSMEGHAKGQMPFLDRIKRHNEEYNARVMREALERPWLKRVAVWLGAKLLVWGHR